MNKKFLKLCLASILSLSLHTNLQAQELWQPYFCAQEEEEEINEAITDFINEVEKERPDINVRVSEKYKSIDLVDPCGVIRRNVPVQDINEILEYLGEQEWISSLDTLRIDGLPHNFNALSNVMSQMPQLTALSINFVKLDDEYLGGLGAFLSHASNLKTLNLTQNDINEPAMIQFVNALQQTDEFEGGLHLQNLNLSENYLGEKLEEDGLQALATFLSFTPNLQTLNLSSNNLGEKLSVLTPIANMQNLRRLNLTFNEIDDSAMINFIDTLFQERGSAEMSNLHNLDLRSNSIGFMGVDGLQAFVTFLSLMPNLRTLDISYNFLDELEESNLQKLFNNISFIPNLKTLILDNNDLGESLAALAPALAQMPNLKKLSLAENEIDESAMVSFADAISQIENFQIPNLAVLDLPGNNLAGMEMEGWQALVTFLSYAPNLSILTLYSNNLTSDSAPSLIDFFLLLQRDCMLTVLLDDDEIDEQTADSILAALEGRVQNIQLCN